MILVGLGALIVGLALGLCGAGGSILTVPVLVYLLQHPEKAAIAESLAIVGGIAAVGALNYARQRRVRGPAVLLFGLPGMAGAYLGAWVSGHVPSVIQMLLFAAVMIWASVSMARRAASDAAPRRIGPPRPAILALQGLGVGAVTGLVGVGGGFLIVPALVLLGRIEMHAAVGTSLAIITLQSLAGLGKHLHIVNALGLHLDWPVILAFGTLGAAASVLGSQLSPRIPQRSLQRGFAALLLVMGLFILSREMLALRPSPAEAVHAVHSGETP